jgi:GST-like protein
MIDIFQGEMERLFVVLARILDDGRDYLAGDYTIGDIMHFPWLRFPLDLKFPGLMKHDRVVAWLERIRARPAVEKGLSIPS